MANRELGETAVVKMGFVRLLIVGLLSSVLLSGCGDDVESSDAKPAETRPLNSATVVVKDFVEVTEIEGNLGFGEVARLPNRSSGTVTWVPELGSVIGFGETLYEVDERPVLLLEGDVPVYRVIGIESEPGPDIERLERMLVEAGYTDDLSQSESDDTDADGTGDDVDGTEDTDGTDGTDEVVAGQLWDQEFTTQTEEALLAWQADRGLLETGTLEPGVVVYLPAPIRVSAVSVVPGERVNGGVVLSYTSTERLVSVSLDTELVGIVEVGRNVEVELPDGSFVDGTVTFVSSVAQSTGQGPQASTFVPVEIVLDESDESVVSDESGESDGPDGSGDVFDESPVTVRIEEVLERDALAIPIAALVALAEGGYAVEVLDESDQPHLVGVELGTFHKNEVSVSGDLTPGTRVVVP